MPSAISVFKGANYRKARTTNATDTSFASRVATLTEPTGTGVIDLRSQGASPRWVSLIPYALGDDDDVFEMWVIGWRKVVVDGVTLWIPTRLVKLTCTVSTAVGVADSPVLATERFADTITASMGVSNVSYQLFSPTDNTIAHALVSPDGCEKIELIFDSTTGDPTSMNCLVAKV